MRKVPGVLRGKGLSIVVEVDIHVSPPLQIAPDSSGIGQQLLRRVATGVAATTTVATEIDETGGQRQVSDKIGPVGHAEANAGCLTESDDLGANPAFMPEFQGMAGGIRGQQLQKLLQPADIAGKIWRELPEDDPELGAEEQRPGHEARQGLFRFDKLFDMGDETAPLETEGKGGWGYQLPVSKGLRLQQAIEGDIELDAAESRAIVIKPPLGREVVRIKAPAPVRIAEAAAADAEFGHFRLPRNRRTP